MEFMADMALEWEMLMVSGYWISVMQWNWLLQTLVSREKNKLAIYVSGGTVSAIDYLLLRRCDRRYIKKIKVIAGEECVWQHRLLGNVVICSAPRKKKNAHTKAESMEAERAQYKTRICSVGNRQHPLKDRLAIWARTRQDTCRLAKKWHLNIWTFI